jgi:hypothetical protein
MEFSFSYSGKKCTGNKEGRSIKIHAITKEMVYKKFDFEYKHRLKKYKASCTVMDALHFPGNIMYRVVVVSDKNEQVYIFYKVDKPGNMFYWFPYADTRERIATSIAESLEDVEMGIKK